MNKILVEIILPAAGQTYEVYIPLESKIHETADLLAVLLGSLAGNKYQPSKTNLLCDAKTGKILDINKSVAGHGLRNGSRLFLV
ncbi:MAG: methyltransferase [Peptococcaceae bacterium]|jgi:hypothetical protein|nr:methyltransferase [Peptococcaceae bacterium]